MILNQILNFDWNLVIYTIVPFAISMSSIIIYNTFKVMFKKHTYHDHTVIDAIISEYNHRLEDYGKAIAELRTKIDTLEFRSSQQYITDNRDTSDAPNSDINDEQIMISHHESQIKQHQPHTPIETVPFTITQKKSNNVYHGTSITHSILELLVEKPMTSREIQLAIGRTREHTSRLMKKLYISNLVQRVSNNKPFQYFITDDGRKELNGHRIILER